MQYASTLTVAGLSYFPRSTYISVEYATPTSRANCFGVMSVRAMYSRMPWTVGVI